ncbi:MAG: tripartite tricarboxylate transporter substrate-binding protein, partial [Burkholderiales bacterium]
LGGQVQLMFATMPAAMPHVRSGKLRAIAVTSAKRSQAMPELPTIGETLKGYEASTWYGVLLPAHTPRAIVTLLHAQIVKILGAVDTRDRLLAQGFEPVGGTPAEFGAYIKAEIAKWGKVIKAAGIKAE